MRISGLNIVVSLLALVAGSVGVASAADGVVIAGLSPDRRPDMAPRVLVTAHPQAWYAHAVSGIAAPYPRSLFFLDNQGDWFTPFDRPGMVGRYDLRGWHRTP